MSSWEKIEIPKLSKSGNKYVKLGKDQNSQVGPKPLTIHHLVIVSILRDIDSFHTSIYKEAHGIHYLEVCPFRPCAHGNYKLIWQDQYIELHTCHCSARWFDLTYPK